MRAVPENKTPSKAGSSSGDNRRPASKVVKNSKESPSKTTPSKKGSKETFTHRLPTDEQRRRNGRVVGRSLIGWNRPRMVEKLLLNMTYELMRNRCDIPWESIAHRLHPGSSGPAIQQFLGRVRRNLTAEGHLIPPVFQRGVTVDPEVRGYVRKYTDGKDKESTRPVLFTESLEDRRFNLPDAYDGQGIEQSQDLSDAESDDEAPDTPTPIGRSSTAANGLRAKCDEPAISTEHDDEVSVADEAEVEAEDDMINHSFAMKPNDNDDMFGWAAPQTRGLYNMGPSPFQAPIDVDEASSPYSHYHGYPARAPCNSIPYGNIPYAQVSPYVSAQEVAAYSMSPYGIHGFAAPPPAWQISPAFSYSAQVLPVDWKVCTTPAVTSAQPITPDSSPMHEPMKESPLSGPALSLPMLLEPEPLDDGANSFTGLLFADSLPEEQEVEETNQDEQSRV